MKESLKPGFIKQAAEKLKQADRFLGTGQWFAGDRVRSFQTCCLVISVKLDLHSVSKNVTSLSHYNSDIHESILIIFGLDVTEKVGNQKILYFCTSPT